MTIQSSSYFFHHSKSLLWKKLRVFLSGAGSDKSIGGASNNNSSRTRRGFLGRVKRRRTRSTKGGGEEAALTHPHTNAHARVVTTALYGDYSNSIAKDHLAKNDTIRLTVDGVGEEIKEAGPGDFSSAEDLHNLNIGWRDFNNDNNTYRRNTNANTNSAYSPNLAGVGTNRAQEEIIRALKILLSRQEREDAEKKRLNEWRVIAIAVDRILFWIFFIVTTVSSVVFLVILPLVKRSEYVRNT
ncbi:uncharacterized protein LOC121866092 [Homarus americanus]|uniref:uncharacterized protein LOC121866092 n=1 Tax=Homarus americanus TaxID=6706 RepID=UPI001C44A28A|nr:uncharacterized protein LOC121866092 [Homarus americanus]